MTKQFLATAALAAALTLPAGLQAQVGQGDQATVNATANILSQLAVNPGNDLEFGDVVPGIDRTVAPSDAGAGTVTVSASANLPIRIGFSLPTVLDGPGGATLPITFASNSAQHDAGASSVTFNPNSDFDTNSGSGSFTVSFGGTVQPAQDQAQGSYSGDITVEVNYIGS